MAGRRKPPEERTARLIDVGRVVGAYGVRGWVKVLADDPESLVAQTVWWVGGEVRTVEEAKQHSGTVLARFAGYGDRAQAEALKGLPVALPRESLPAPEAGQYFWSDLVGLEVRNTAGTVLGRVQSMFSNGAHDVMALEGPRERLLPWVPTVVKAVDLEAKRIEVDWEADW